MNRAAKRAGGVRTVAGRSGDVTLTYEDISGLGTAAQHPASDFLQVGQEPSAAVASSARATLGLGSIAAQNANAIAVTGGQASGMHALHLSNTYAQNVAPSDVLNDHGTPLRIVANGTLSDTGAFGPHAATALYGPRALANIEGTTQIGADQSTFAMTPIGFGDMLVERNVVGSDRAIVPGWVFMSARSTIADTNAVTLGGNDIASGRAAFVDAQTFGTANSGTLDGTSNSYEIISALSMPFVIGNSHISRRTGFKVNDLNEYLGRPGTAINLAGNDYVPGAEMSVGIVDEQYGLYVPRLTQGAVRNVGIYNASATVQPGRAVDVSSSSDTIPIDATTVDVSPLSDLVLSSTPTIAAGLDGQQIVIRNVGSRDLTLQDKTLLAASNLYLTPGCGGRRVISPNQVLRLTYSAKLGYWLEDAPRMLVAFDGTPSHGLVAMSAGAMLGVPSAGVGAYRNVGDEQFAAFIGVFDGRPSVQLGPGGSTAPDIVLQRTGVAAASFAGVLTLTSGLTIADANDITIEGTTGTKIGQSDSKIGFFGATPRSARTGWGSPIGSLSRAPLGDPAYTTTGAAGTIAGAFDTAAHRDNVITDLFTLNKTVQALIADLKDLGIINS